MYVGTPMQNEDDTDYKLSVFKGQGKKGEYIQVNVQKNNKSHKAFLNVPKEE